ncbi:serine hydrolase-like protein 2 [Zerene cesonia]|uniref:serine hydrolase-like protein 2 n=1 Tax=Zerene cesonia TaxID=33412 RepID=UPI0018E50B8C|nr:serine hydrolase-like protein 2 [Zerene cesonia]XP_038221547.1 serine hydrolase-like protein 2 [Zerene cesonia]
MAFIEKEWFIEAPWGKICIVAWGNCLDPPVLVCHGIIDSAASFRPLVKLLPKNFYYIAVELPGNGRSDAFPRGVVLSSHDFVYALHVVVRHFRWDNFALLTHSFGAAIGRFYNLCYPGKVTKVIDIEPIARKIPVPPEEFKKWFKANYVDYFENYEYYNMTKQQMKKFPKEEAIKKLMKSRSLTRQCAEATLERMTEPAGNGYLRYTYDQRMKLVSSPPLSPEHIKKLYTSITTPTLSIMAKDTVGKGGYKQMPFMLDEMAYPNGNYRVRYVKGGHDVHFNDPGVVAPFVTQFLLYGLEGLGGKAKL